MNRIHAKYCSAGWAWSEPSSFKADTSHAGLPGQYASTSSFWAEVRVGEPSSDSGIRGLSTNFAFLRGAKDKKKRQREGGKGVGKRGEQKGRKEEKGKRNRGKEKGKRNIEGSWVRGTAGNRWKHLNERHSVRLRSGYPIFCARKKKSHSS